MEYVIDVLCRYFHKGEAEAISVMLTVHKKGKAIAAVYRATSPRPRSRR